LRDWQEAGVWTVSGALWPFDFGDDFGVRP